MANILDTLKERGLVKQTVFEDELYEKLGKESVTFYVGFDPTADSLHAGHFLALMAMGRIQRAGHRPIVLIGGGTAMVGDPTGRTDMRSMMTKETIANNVAKFKEQMSRFFSFEGEKPPTPYPQDLIDCILDGTPTLLSQEDSFKNTEAVIRAQQSADTGRVVKF